jgi:hypothetical protein
MTKTKLTSKDINLTVLNKLVEALQEQVKLVAELPQETPNETRVVELSRALGLCSGISYESGGLVSDILAIIKDSSVPETNLVDLLGGLTGKTMGKN